MVFDNVKVPVENVLGKVNDGFKLIMCVSVNFSLAPSLLVCSLSLSLSDTLSLFLPSTLFPWLSHFFSLSLLFLTASCNLSLAAQVQFQP